MTPEPGFTMPLQRKTVEIRPAFVHGWQKVAALNFFHVRIDDFCTSNRFYVSSPKFCVYYGSKKNEKN
jgi:hypothetical protein